MARVELEIPDADQLDFTRQARMEGMTLDGWLIKIARQRVEKQKPDENAQPQLLAELEEFWRWCDSRQDGDREPDWEEHLRTMAESRRKGLPDV